MSDYDISKVSPRPWSCDNNVNTVCDAGKFVVSICGTQSNNAHIVHCVNLVERLRGLCEKALAKQRGELERSASIGLAIAPQIARAEINIHEALLAALTGDLGPLERLAGAEQESQPQGDDT